MGRSEDGGVHGGEAEASIPRPARGQGLGDREYVPEWGCDCAWGSRDPSVPPPAAVGGGERPRGAHRDVSVSAGGLSQSGRMFSIPRMSQRLFTVNKFGMERERGDCVFETVADSIRVCDGDCDGGGD